LLKQINAALDEENDKESVRSLSKKNAQIGAELVRLVSSTTRTATKTTIIIIIITRTTTTNNHNNHHNNNNNY
jgi:hypothetical protein